MAATDDETKVESGRFSPIVRKEVSVVRQIKTDWLNYNKLKDWAVERLDDRNSHIRFRVNTLWDDNVVLQIGVTNRRSDSGEVIHSFCIIDGVINYHVSDGGPGLTDMPFECFDMRVEPITF